jgi:hypothetical protein
MGNAIVYRDVYRAATDLSNLFSKALGEQTRT